MSVSVQEKEIARMKVMPFLKTVLDEMWDRLPAGSVPDKEALIKAEGEYLRKRYADLISATEPIDYQRAQTRFAYVLCHVACHANMVRDKIRNAEHVSALFEQERVVVSCIGGALMLTVRQRPFAQHEWWVTTCPIWESPARRFRSV